MKGLFADTFYWIALTDLADSAHQRAPAFSSERKDAVIVTADEVLAEYPRPTLRQLTNAFAGKPY